jgi:cysteinyl-tRNA synthetase
MPDYGCLSGRRLDEQQAGARVAVDAQKKHPGDFVLWKGSSASEPGWDSPWGRGRPGWHIECSAMSAAYLGETFDIHGGGLDLIFPHHENEIAQSRCAHGTPVMAKTWMHNGFLQIEGEKMSKSTGNFVTINELLETDKFGDTWAGDILRLAMLRTHYRSPIDWTVKALDETHKILWDWYRDVENVQPSPDVPQEVLKSLSDDLNTSGAITALHALRKEGRFADLRAGLKFMGLKNLGSVLSRRPAGARAGAPALQLRVAGGTPSIVTSQPTADDIEALVTQRTQARANKDFKESDRIRDELLAMGVVLKDGKDAAGKPATTWEYAR